MRWNRAYKSRKCNLCSFAPPLDHVKRLPDHGNNLIILNARCQHRNAFQDHIDKANRHPVFADGFKQPCVHLIPLLPFSAVPAINSCHGDWKQIISATASPMRFISLAVINKTAFHQRTRRTFKPFGSGCCNGDPFMTTRYASCHARQMRGSFFFNFLEADHLVHFVPFRLQGFWTWIQDSPNQATESRLLPPSCSGRK